MMASFRSLTVKTPEQSVENFFNNTGRLFDQFRQHGDNFLFLQAS